MKNSTLNVLIALGIVLFVDIIYLLAYYLLTLFYAALGVEASYITFSLSRIITSLLTLTLVSFTVSLLLTEMNSNYLKLKDEK